MRRYLLAIFLATPLLAQSPLRQIRVVLPDGAGGIPVVVGDGWNIESAHLYNDEPGAPAPIYRAVVQSFNSRDNLVASYLLFVNDTKAPTAEGCRSAVMEPLITGMSKRATLKNQQQSIYRTADGRQLAVSSYLIEQADGHKLDQQNIFAFLGDEHNCAEMHLSKVQAKPSDDQIFNAQLDRFRLESAYTPDSMDYFAIGTILFNKQHDVSDAAIFYDRSLATFPSDGPAKMRRVVTDQLSMSYGMSGDLAKSRAVNEAAIAKDPDYPLYYYNLACADAESGNAADARKHLEQAFARRGNTLPGEHMPDPTTDDSILKLKQNKEFWAFVQALPKN
jgi:tetratricopeptide (TPR) repeat protein